MKVNTIYSSYPNEFLWDNLENIERYKDNFHGRIIYETEQMRKLNFPVFDDVPDNDKALIGKCLYKCYGRISLEFLPEGLHKYLPLLERVGIDIFEKIHEFQCRHFEGEYNG